MSMSLCFQAHLPKPTMSSPHPRLLGSLGAMLFRHYSGGMGIDTLCFDQVSSDDPSVTGPGYVDIPAGALPNLEGAGEWWKVPPASSESVFGFSDDFGNPRVANFRLSSSPSEVERAENAPGRNGVSGEPVIRQVDSSAQAGSRNTNLPSSEVPMAPSENTGTVQTLKRKRRRARQDEEEKAPLSKKKRKAKSGKFVHSDEEDEMEAGPSTGLKLKIPGKGKALSQPKVSEEPKVCDGSREHVDIDNHPP